MKPAEPSAEPKSSTNARKSHAAIALTRKLDACQPHQYQSPASAVGSVSLPPKAILINQYKLSYTEGIDQSTIPVRPFVWLIFHSPPALASRVGLFFTWEKPLGQALHRKENQ